MSPVPGGRSSSSTSRSPQNTSPRNCCSARCSIGPRHTTGWLPGTNMPIEMTFTSCAMRRQDHVVDLGRPAARRRASGAPRSRRRRRRPRPTRSPSRGHRGGQVDGHRWTCRRRPCRRRPRTRGSASRAGRTGSRARPAPPRSCSAAPSRCSSLITSSSTSTADAGDARRPRLVTSRVSVSFIGQPATVRKIAAATRPASSTSTRLDHAELGDGLADLGVVDPRERGQQLVPGRQHGGRHVVHRMSGGRPPGRRPATSVGRDHQSRPCPRAPCPWSPAPT